MKISKIKSNNFVGSGSETFVFDSYCNGRTVDVIDPFNYLAIILLEKMGDDAPNEEMIAKFQNCIFFYTIRKFLSELLNLTDIEIDFFLFLIDGNTIRKATKLFFRCERTLRDWRYKILEKIGVSSLESAIIKLTNAPVRLTKEDFDIIITKLQKTDI